MLRHLKYTCLLAILSLGCKEVHAQSTDDFALRQKIGVDIPILKNTEINTSYRLLLNDNASKFKNSLIALGITQEVAPNWKIGAEYRYYTSYSKDNHRFSAFTRYTFKVGRFDVGYRLQYQQRQQYFDADYLGEYQPQRVFRNRVLLKCNLDKKCGIYTYGELFSQLKNQDLSSYRMRYGLGLDYRFKKRHCFNGELFMNRDFGTKPSRLMVAELSYTYQLKGLKKKNKRTTRK